MRVGSITGQVIKGHLRKGWARPDRIIIGIGSKKYFTTFLIFLYDIIIYIVELIQQAIKYDKKTIL